MQLFLDEKGVIRCKSRVKYLIDTIREGAPVLVKTDHPYVTSYIKHKHIVNNCTGANATINNVKWKIFGLKLKKVVKNIVKACNICAISRAFPYHYPSQPGLPIERLYAQAHLTL